MNETEDTQMSTVEKVVIAVAVVKIVEIASRNYRRKRKFQRTMKNVNRRLAHEHFTLNNVEVERKFEEIVNNMHRY